MTVFMVTSKADFDAKLESAGDKLVVVDFFAEWCGPCKMIGPKIAIMAKEYTDVVFLKVDVDHADVEDFVQDLGISAMPTFKFFKNKKECCDPVMGANEKNLRTAIDANK
eukprot:TRINITY_DN2159_c0_g2_i14.p1 TRINITY_DN2159_c0_g2~~TRINITY_DN2159_c0_g2_i14.p1  ORF type:complete len:110 (+),score=24.47 TRINITY_DN2159_c0_g2_i14:316-645(+)